ncbi:MAG: hypothetical protein EOP41_08410 [Sphingobacteriaceae bacterium]|nr:MAG: hypothetical protein EOP41_08410 [Sphingobacteriaceae bacterium]
MEIDYIILDSSSAGELELLLDEKALDGYKAVSMNVYFDPARGMVYSALMVNYGLNNQIEELVSQISEKLDTLGITMQFIETSISDKNYKADY